MNAARLPAGGISKEGGFTYTELLVAATILALIAVPVLSVLLNGYRYTVTAGQRTVAVHLCRERLEELRARGYHGCLALFEGGPRVELSGEADPLPEGYGAYRRETVIEKKAFEFAPGREAGYLRVRVTVHYRGRGGESTVVLETNLGGR